MHLNVWNIDGNPFYNCKGRRTEKDAMLCEIINQKYINP